MSADGEQGLAAQPYQRGDQGIWEPLHDVEHREDEYDSAEFDILMEMQERHFWYRGRHRFLLHSVRSHLEAHSPASAGEAIDLGGGCGGWIKYLAACHPGGFSSLAVADSSYKALEFAGQMLGAEVDRYRIDLLHLGWRDRWDAAFLLDVIEHIPQDVAVMQQVAAALKPGGIAFVTTPALQKFWSYNDDLAKHLRRYSKSDYRSLADQSGLEFIDARYFMTFLSPLLLASRMRAPDVESMDAAAVREHMARTHRVPPGLINAMLGLVFSAETPLGHLIPFPWGTSILGVFRKPSQLRGPGGAI